jgi:hypothetical protein
VRGLFERTLENQAGRIVADSHTRSDVQAILHIMAEDIPQAL